MSKALTAYTREELETRGVPPLYEGDHLREIAFPLGGIGTGCVSLHGRGALLDWEIFNRPNKGTILPYTFFTIWAQAEGAGAGDARAAGAAQPPFSGAGRRRLSRLRLWRDARGWLRACPTMRSATFAASSPWPRSRSTIPTCPCRSRLEAYSPFIPLNAGRLGPAHRRAALSRHQSRARRR